MTDDLLICSYRDYLIAYLKKKFRRGRFEDIEDAVQNTLIKAVRFHDKWNKNCSLKTWLSIIAVNMYTDTFRKTYLRNEYLLDSSEDLFLFDQISVDDFSVKLCDDEQHSSLISDLFSDFKDNVHIEAFKLSVIDEIDYKNDIESVASLISELDLVITIQNAIAHISCALGKETWVLVPLFCRNNWGVKGRKCDWYKTAVTYRQEKPFFWTSVLSNVYLDLSDRIKSNLN